MVAQTPHATRVQSAATVQMEHSVSAFPSFALFEADPALELDTESEDSPHPENQAIAPVPSLTVSMPAEPKAPRLEVDLAWLPQGRPDGPAFEENSRLHLVEGHALVEKSATAEVIPPSPSAAGIQDTATRESAGESEPNEKSESREHPLPVPSFVSLSPEFPRQVAVPHHTFPTAENESRRLSGTPITSGDLETLRRVQEPPSGRPLIEFAEPVAREAFRILLRQTTPYHARPDAIEIPTVETGATLQPKLDDAVTVQAERETLVVAPPEARAAEADLTPTLTRRGLDPSLAGTSSKPTSEVSGRPILPSQPVAARFDEHTGSRGEGTPPPRVEAKTSTHSEEEPHQGNSAKDERLPAPPQTKEFGPVWTSSHTPSETHPRSERTGSAAEAAPVAPIEEPAPVVPAARTVRQLRLSVETTPTGSSVELLLQQRPDGVEVSVHSQDNQVRDSLRTGLSDLVNNLEKQGIASDIVHPLRSNLTEHSSDLSVHKARAEELASPVAEASESEAREDTHRQPREPLWEAGSDQRRRRDQRPDAWQKYLEEYTWRNR